MANDFRHRVRVCLRRGHLTTADLQHWFGCPYSTIRTWLKEDRAPGAASVSRFSQRLHFLEVALRTQRHFPVPVDISQRQRATYIRGIRDDFEQRGRKVARA